MPDTNRAFEHLAFDKENFETWVDETGQTVLSDVQWEKVKDELDGRVENYLDEMIYNVVIDFREGMYDD
jgi:trimethylamine:corrinoid methyltransferase-like protein